MQRGLTPRCSAATETAATEGATEVVGEAGPEAPEGAATDEITDTGVAAEDETTPAEEKDED